jgi:uncharacterized protein YcaQ
MADSLSLPQARRVALAAQGFAQPRPAGAITMRQINRVLARIGLLQIDSVNVLARAHYLPLFSRLGAYPTDLLDRASARAPRALFEYWGHEASLLPVAMHPLLRWRMRRWHESAWGGMQRIARERPDLVRAVLAEVAERGPVTAAQIETDVPRQGVQWGWNWSDTKQALEWLFYSGAVTCARRTGSFARMYDLPERVLPREVLQAPTPTDSEAMRELVGIAAAALGVAAAPELRDYFRLPAAGFRQALVELVDEGVVLPVTVAGWRTPAYLHREAAIPRRITVSTVVSPFDPLVWERGRAERLFDFRYRIEIYTPAAKRVHGYYVLPFLLGDAIVARVDLKADRDAGVLRIPASFLEPGRDPDAVATALARSLRELGAWLGLESVAPPERGDLAGPLGGALRGRSDATVET